MDSPDVTERISQHMLFKELVTRRAKVVRLLMSVGLIANFVLIALVAFFPQILRMPVEPGEATTIGVVLAVGIIVLGWAITWIYVYMANGTFDRLSAVLVNEVAR
ncbi:DUF485 domain-containing protein [Pandoraea soli]|uniref:Inner membrane protein YjcH n=1 Tax=Pandoraea soli TaxID=2508293 RepID=A0ABY6W6D7_9BURK|nr:DUF485 domain-containing protein [Pandoraea soli]VVE27020.1 Inner membrane protein YjcH [Pandoraea soli]